MSETTDLNILWKILLSGLSKPSEEALVIDVIRGNPSEALSHFLLIRQRHIRDMDLKEFLKPSDQINKKG